MTTPPRRTLAAAIALVLATGIGAAIQATTSVSAVSVDTAVERFRATQATTPVPANTSVIEALAATPEVAGAGPQSATGATPAASTDPAPRDGATPTVASADLAAAGPARPRPGVYRYATDGREDLAIVGGAHHDYPDETTMTVTPTACGADIRWDALEERYDRWITCLTGTSTPLVEFTTYHSFYGQVVEKTYGCADGAAFRPASDAPGTRFGGRCLTDDGDEATLTGTVVGVESMTVGGRSVQAVRITLDEVLIGDTKGTRTSESWYAVDTNLLLKRTSTIDADSSTPFGYSHYTEQLTVTLASLDPIQ